MHVCLPQYSRLRTANALSTVKLAVETPGGVKKVTDKLIRTNCY